MKKKWAPRDVAGYIAAQIVGGFVAAAFLLAIARGASGGYDPTVTGFGANGHAEHPHSHNE